MNSPMNAMNSPSERDRERQRAEQLAAQLKELGVEPAGSLRSACDHFPAPRFSNRYSPLFPGQTRSRSPSPSMSIAVSCRPVPAVPAGKSLSARRSAALAGRSWPARPGRSRA